MPYFFETNKIPLPREFDRRVKITEMQKKTIRYMYTKGFSQRAIARYFSISRRMVSFILFPEREAVCKMQYKKRRIDGRYYHKTKHTKAVREYRKYKYSILSSPQP